MHTDALQRLGLLDGQGDMTVPGIVALHIYFQVFGLERVLTVEVHPERVLVDGINVLLRLAEGAHRVWRATETRDIVLAVLGPAHGVGKLLSAAKGFGIEVIFTVKGDTAEDAVVQFVLDIVNVLGINGSLEHAPREQQHTNLCTNLVVGSLLRQLELPAVSLMDLLNRGLVVGSSVG